MNLGVPGKVVEILPGPGGLALVEVAGARRPVSIGLLDDDEEAVRPGDWVLVHVGFAMSRIDEKEAALTLLLLEGSGGANTGEPDAAEGSDIT